jgi:hypothetical protein
MIFDVISQLINSDFWDIRARYLRMLMKYMCHFNSFLTTYVLLLC